MSKHGFEVYDPESDIWRSLPSLSIDIGTRLVSINGKLLAIGVGVANYKNKASKIVYEYDTINESWLRQPEMNIARIHHRAVVVN